MEPPPVWWIPTPEYLRAVAAKTCNMFQNDDLPAAEDKGDRLAPCSRTQLVAKYQRELKESQEQKIRRDAMMMRARLELTESEQQKDQHDLELSNIMVQDMKDLMERDTMERKRISTTKESEEQKKNQRELKESQEQKIRRDAMMMRARRELTESEQQKDQHDGELVNTMLQHMTDEMERDTQWRKRLNKIKKAAKRFRKKVKKQTEAAPFIPFPGWRTLTIAQRRMWRRRAQAYSQTHFPWKWP